MSYKTEKLKARIAEKFGTQKAFCEAAGMTESTLSRYLSTGKDWKGSMLIRACKLLDIPATEVDLYFFDPDVSKRKREARA